ncbi:MAG: ribbon-helix-helix protein, CopG family [Betaproteobacteria bacterium]|nr:ribbon-helix-helix protein, CopG family [Betaproteobacteria bacterium]
MAATSIKLPDELKKRIDTLVADSGKTAHAFMVEAIERETERAELRRRFHADASAAEMEVNTSGKAFDAREVFDYLEGKLKGKKVSKPRLRKWPPSS